MSIAFVQSNHAEASGTGTTIAVTLTGVTAGDGIVGSATFDSSGVSLSNVKDNTPTTANADAAHNWAVGTQSINAWSIPNSPSGSRTFTATFSATTTSRGIQSLEFSGLPTAAGSFVTGTPAGDDGGSGTTTAFDSTISTTPGVSGALIFQVGEGGSTQPAVGAGWTGGPQDAVNTVTTGYKILGAPAATSPSFTLSPADAWSVLVVAYKPASTGLAGIDDGGPQRQPPDIAPRRLPGVDAPPPGFNPRGLLDQAVPRARPPYQPLGRNRGASESPSPFSARGLMEERPPVLGRARAIPTKLVPDAGAPLPTSVVTGLPDANLQRPAASPDRPFPAAGVDQPIGFPPVGMLDAAVPRAPATVRPPRPALTPEAVPAPPVTAALQDDGADVPARTPRVPIRSIGSAETIIVPPVTQALPDDGPRRAPQVPRGAPRITTAEALPSSPIVPVPGEDAPRAPRLSRAATRAPITETGPRVPLTFGDGPIPSPAPRRIPVIAPPVPEGFVAPAPVHAFADVLVRARGRLARWLPRLFGDDGWLTAFIPLPRLKQPTSVVVAPYATAAAVAPFATTTTVAPFATSVTVPQTPTRTTTTAGDQPSTVQLDT